MSAAAVVLSCCFLAQTGANDRYGNDNFDPRFSPGRSQAPAASIDTDDSSQGLDMGRRNDSRQNGPNNARPFDSRSASPTDSRDLQPVNRSPAGKLRPPDILAEALAEPAQGAVVGTPITLGAALTRSQNRQQQLKIAQAYWKLSTVQAQYHWIRDARERFVQYTDNQTNRPDTLSARAAMRADVADAHLAVLQAQQQLSDLLMRNERQLPLASTQPHVGGYDTRYDEIFSGRPAPPRMQLIHRTMPFRRKAIDLHAEAIVAALDALESVGEDFLRQQASLTSLLAALDRLQHERQAFATDVKVYNQDIAEYLLTVAPADTSPQTLASKLVLPGQRESTQARGRGDSRPLSYEEPSEGSASSEEDWTTRYRPGAADDSLEEQGLYSLLAEQKAPLAAQQLAGILHWDRALPDDASQGTSLADCLRNAPAASRVEVLRAYWTARERAAAFQAAGDKVEQLNSLSTIVSRRTSQQGMAEAGLRLQAARRAAYAERADAQAALVAAQFDLTMAIGRPLDRPWVVPATPPQAGGYELGEDAPRREPFLASRVRLGHQRLMERADAVVNYDALRASLTNEARAGKGSARDAVDALDDAVEAVNAQYRETVTFLSDVTDYNLAIARYVMSNLPNLPPDDLVKRLVVVPRDGRT